MPFTLRSFEDEKKARMGVIECAKHDLMEPYPVYFEKDGEFVAEFKFTVLLMPNSTMKITGLPLDFDCYQTENSITDETLKVLFELKIIFLYLKLNIKLQNYNQNLLALSLTQKKKKKKSSNKKTTDANNKEESGDEEEEVKK